MPVLGEAIFVILRIDAIARCMDNDWSNCVEVVPNQTLCCDSELARGDECSGARTADHGA